MNFLNFLLISFRIVGLPFGGAFLISATFKVLNIPNLPPFALIMPLFVLLLITEIYYWMVRRRIDKASNAALRIILEAVYAEKEMEIPAKHKV